ncbi:hypothetical protein NDU88_008693 [Pleurodeles waltl]|uniref:Uncharacterized protein n=1 Tax=Pleurodeles waltl TaxID=8319 RepID=A0AAV7QSG5_PLEWA|nr:hypothetical protein NDU88_008693 [Pleurodeles waltl]
MCQCVRKGQGPSPGRIRSVFPDHLPRSPSMSVAIHRRQPDGKTSRRRPAEIIPVVAKNRAQPRNLSSLQRMEGRKCPGRRSSL